MKDYKNQHGFRVSATEYIEEIDATLVDMLHEKSGARLIFLDRQDDNTTFCISFKTTPTDDMGVFHILEHSVLCGSRKFPIKDPFNELIKGSMSTYLNALTSGDKTLYPVSSKNRKSFFGLVDVYLDAVFHPLALENPYIFMQEGHRYEFDEDDDLNVTGVVYNEMQGIYDSADDYADYLISRLTCPGGTYSYDSGGHPDFIPELTYEQFKSTHEKFYHPSNACIFLDGDVDLCGILALIDSYLSEYDRRECDIEIDDGGEIVTEITHAPYPIEDGEDPTDKTRIYISYNSFPHSEDKKSKALAFAVSVIADSNNSPLTKRILDTGLCESFNFYPTHTYKVNALNASFMGVKDGKEEELIKKYNEALLEVLEEGISEEMLSASLKRFEFNIKAADNGTYPTGMVYMRSCLTNAMLGESPADALRYTDLLAFLYEKIGTSYFSDVLKEVISSPHATLVLHPDPTLAQRKEEERCQRLDEIASRMTDEEKARIITETELLREWQNTPDTPEKLATLPTLSLEDIDPEPKFIPTDVTYEDGVAIVLHPIDTRGIAYTDMYFDVSDADEDEIHYLKLFTDLVGEWSTRSGDSTVLRTKIKRHLGGFAVSLSTIMKDNEAKLYINMHHSCLDSEKDNALGILKEYLFETLYDDADVVKKNLKQIAFYSLESIISRGDSYADMRTAARYHAYDAIFDHISGYEYHAFIKALAENIENAEEDVLRRFERICSRYFKRERLTVGVTEKDGEEYAHRLISLIPCGGTPAGKSPVKPLERINEGIAIPGTVSFAVMGTNLNEVGEKLHTGQFYVYQSIASLELLWNEIRLKNGAYDSSYYNLPIGTVAMRSYRDPMPMASLKYFSHLTDRMSDFLNTSPDLTKFIIGVFGESDTVSTPRVDGSLATKRFLSGTSHETFVKRRKELLLTTLDDLFRINEIIEEALTHSTFTVVAPKDELLKIEGIERILEI